MPLKIVIFLTNLGGGGAERTMVNIGNSLVTNGENITFLLLNSRGVYADELNKAASVIDFNVYNYLSAIFAFPRIMQFLRTNRPDCVISALEIPNIFNVIACRLLHSLYCAVVTIHYVQSNPRKNLLLKWIEKYVYRFADAIVAVSNGVREDVVKFYGIPEDRVAVIYNHVDLERIERLSQEDIDVQDFDLPSKRFVLGVGRLSEEKNFTLLLRAFALLRKTKDLDLVILGEGPLRDELISLSSELGVLPHVHIQGFVKNPFAYMKKAAVLVLTSLYEGFGLVILEAMACGCPVVSVDCPSGPAEILDNGKYGKLVKSYDPKVIADAIRETLDYPLSAETLKERAKCFSLTRATHEYRSLINRVIKCRRNRT